MHLDRHSIRREFHALTAAWGKPPLLLTATMLTALLATVPWALAAGAGQTTAADKVVTIRAGQEWLPLDVNLDIEPGSALDFSHLVPRHAPAGKYGRVVVTREGKFAFEKRATPARFYGVDLCCTAQFLPHALADRLADRLVRLGYNTVRIHHHERDLVERTPDALRLRADTLDQLDYLFAALKRRGIYVTTDLYVSRVVALAEVYPDQPAQEPNPAWTFENFYRTGEGSFDVQQFKMAVFINDRAYANYQAFARALLEHKNPYTGLRYVDDPALGWLSVMNEDCPGNFIGGLQGPLRDEWQRAWNRWLAARYPDRAALVRALGDLPNGQDALRGTVRLQNARGQGPATVVFNAFLAEVEHAFFERTRKFLRDELHCPTLLTDCNGWTNTVQLQAARDAFDYVDDHFYVDHPTFLRGLRQPPSRCANTSPVAGGATGGLSCAFTRVFGKPFTVTEFNYCGPGQYRGVGGMLCGALAAVQDWDGVWRHVYAYNREEIERPARLSYFNLAADPLNLAADRAALCLFLRGDLQPAAHAVAITATPDALLKAAQTSCDRTPAWSGLAWITRVGWRFDASPAAGELPFAFSGREAGPFALGAEQPLLASMRQRGWLPAANPSDFEKKRFQSEDGAVTIDAPDGVLAIDTPRTAGGFAPAGKRIATRAATIEVLDADATVWVSSLDGQPIANSRRLLVSHLTDLQNTGTRYGDRQRQLLVDWGQLPHLVRAGRAKVTLRLSTPEQARVYALAVNGRRVGEVPATVAAGVLAIPLSVSAAGKARMLYEVTVDSRADWQRHREAVRADRSVLRYYSFEQTPTAQSPGANVVGAEGALTYQVVRAPGAAVEAFQIVEGRWPGKHAVRLDQNVLAAPAFKLPGKQFSIAGWLRILGMGTHRGNNQATNGTLLSLGSGYWDGFRITYHYPQQSLSLEIGRPKPSHSVGIRTAPVADGVWHHLAATWDGRLMRLYVDGLLAASGEFTDPWTTPIHGGFRIGFANAGVGSVRMDVDEVAIYGRALAADEVLAQACLAAPLSQPAAAHVRKAFECLAAKDSTGAERELAAAVRLPEIRGQLACTLRLARAQCLLDLQHSPEAGRELLAIVDAADAAPQSQRAALDRLRTLVRHSPGNALPAGAHPRLLALPDLTPGERAALRLSLGHRLVAQRRFPAARAEYARIVAQADASPAMRSVAWLRIAQTYVLQHDYTAARAEYQRVAAAADVLPHHRWEAEQQIAAIARLAKGLPARDPVASRVHLPARPKPAMVLYVAASGADANPGTADKPFATLERARDEIRRKKQAGGLPAGGVEVCLRGGRYAVRETFVLAAADSGNASAPIVYRAEPGQQPVFSGGLTLSGFQVVDDPAVRARLPEESRDRVRQVDLRRYGLGALKPLVLGGYASGHGFRTFPVMELYCNGTPQPLARWPNQGWAEVADIVVSDGHKIHNRVGSKVGRVRYDGDRPRRWLKEPDAFLHGYWFWDWADSYERIASIDVEQREFTLAPPWHRYGYCKGQRYYAVNLLAELDAPGEWYLDRRSGRLYFYPPTDLARAKVELSVFDRPMVRMEQAEHVTLEGLTWDLGAADALLLRACRHCLLTGCTVRRFAGDGVTVDGGTACGLLACNIDSLGRGGVHLSGGDRKTLARADHFVENCRIHHLSRIHPTYTPAVRVTGVGSRIAHNLFHDIASSAINLAGNEHLVELNEAYNIVMESDDQGGVDMFGNPTYRGNVFRYNYWHHVGDWQATSPHPPGGRAGIRLDDAISGVLVYGNVFYRSSTGTWPFGGLQIHGGKDNVADNNLFVDCHVAISFSPWKEERWREYTHAALDARDIDRQLYLRRYPQLAQLAENPNANLVLRNVVFDCGQFLARERGTNELIDNCLTGENPGCPGASQGRFQLRPDAPLLDACGFLPIPFDEIGPYGSQRPKE